MLALLLACTAPPDGEAPGGAGAHPAPAGATDPGHAGAHGAATQGARAAPTLAAPWDGPWTITLYAGVDLPSQERGAVSALATGLGVTPRAWTGERPPTRAGEAAVVWMPAGSDLDATARRLAPPGPSPSNQGEVVAVLAPGEPAWATAAAERLPWAAVAVVDPAASLALWGDPPPSTPDLAGWLAARLLADHYDHAYTPAPVGLPPGLEAWLGPWDAGMLASKDPRTRSEAVRAAAAPPAAAADDPCVAVRLALAQVARDPAVRAKLAEDPDPLVRARVAEHLDDVAVLARLTEDRSSVVRVVATDRLGRLARAKPADVAEPLKRALGSPDAYQRWKAAWGVGYVPGSAAALVPLLTDPDIDVRREAARSLGRQRDASALDPLLAALKDDNSFVRRWAAAALGDIGDPRAKDALRVAAKEPTALVAQAAARALSQLGEPTRAPPFSPLPPANDDAELDRRLASADATIRKDACKLLAGRADADARLARLAADPDSEVRKSAVEAMGWSAPTAASALPFLRDPDPDVRVTALDTLRRQGVGTVDAIAPLLAETDTEIRLRAAEALATLGPSDALLALSADPDERIRAAVAGVYPDRVPADEPSALVRRAARRPDADPVAAAAPGTPLASWADGVLAREDDLVHLRFSWNDDADRPAAYRALRPVVVRAYGHPDRG